MPDAKQEIETLITNDHVFIGRHAGARLSAAYVALPPVAVSPVYLHFVSLTGCAPNQYSASTSSILSTPQTPESGRSAVVTLTVQLAPLISLAAGIGILVFPKLLNYIVAGYLIVLGILGLMGRGF